MPTFVAYPDYSTPVRGMELHERGIKTEARASGQCTQGATRLDYMYDCS